MKKISLQLPAVINNVPVTADMLRTIDLLQTGGSPQREYEKKSFDDSVLRDKLNDCKELLVYFAGVISNGDSATGNEKEFELLSRIYWLYDLLEEFKTPPELFLTTRQAI